ncbi:MAG: TonB-dependent receptor [Rhizomicrobium sp.]
MFSRVKCHGLSARRSALLCAAALLIPAGVRAADNAASPDAQIETVTVIGQAIYIAPSAPPVDVLQPTSIVQEGFIRDNIIPLGSYDDVVKFEPSVFDASPNGPGLGKSETLSLRGFQDGQYNVTFDGIPFGDSTDLHHTSSALFIAHDLATAEIDRGPGTASTIGKATFGGTMGFVTKSAPDTASLNPYFTYGSFNTISGGLELNTGDTGFGSGFVDYQHENTDGYLTYSAEHRDNVLVKFEHQFDADTTLTLLGSYNHEFQYTTQGATLANMAKYGRDFGLNNDPATQAYYRYNPSDYYSDFAYGDLKTLIGGLRVEDKVYTDYFAHVYTESKDSTITDPSLNTLTIYPDVYNAAGYASRQGRKTTDIPGKATNARFRAFGNVFRVSYDGDFGTVQAGVWYDDQHDNRWSETIDLSTGGTPAPGKNGTPYSYNYHTVSSTIQPFAELDWQVLPELLVTPGVKFSIFQRDVNGPINKGTVAPIDYSEEYDSLQPSVSARYTIDENWNAYAQVARGFLAPPVDVFQVTAPHSIRPETTWNYQVGSTLKRDNFTVSADAYYIDFSNYFAQIQIPGGTDTTFVNGGGAVYQGLEFEGQYALGDGVSFYGNYSLNSAVYKGTSVTIAESPAYTAALGVLYDRGTGFYGSLIGKLIGPRYGDDGNSLDPVTQKLIAVDDVRLGSSATVDLAAGYRFDPLIENTADLVVSVKISNLLDNRQIVDYAGTQSGTDVPLYWTVAGRSVFLNFSSSLY